MKTDVMIWTVVLAIGSPASAKPAIGQPADTVGLRHELAKIQSQIEEAAVTYDETSGDALRDLLGFRLQTLRTTATLVEQRLQAVGGEVPLPAAIEVVEPDELRANALRQTIDSLDVEAAGSLQPTGLAEGDEPALDDASLARLLNLRAVLTAEYVKARFGILELRTHLLRPELTDIRFRSQRDGEWIWFDLEWDTSALPKPAGAVQGVFLIVDRFGMPKLRRTHQIVERLMPNEPYIEKGLGFEYIPFREDHVWVRGSRPEDMSARFEVESIIYVDGTRVDF
jgi:hypothetical protein